MRYEVLQPESKKGTKRVTMICEVLQPERLQQVAAMRHEVLQLES